MVVICTAVCELNPCNVVLKLGYAGAQPELVAALLKAGAEPHAATVSVFSGCPPRGGGSGPSPPCSSAHGVGILGRKREGKIALACHSLG